MESVLALKFRTGEIDEQALTIARRRLEADLGSRRLLLATVADDHPRRARQLLIEHGRTEALRGPDALQLSVALALKRAALVTVFVAADQKLCRVAPDRRLYHPQSRAAPSRTIALMPSSAGTRIVVRPVVCEKLQGSK